MAQQPDRGDGAGHDDRLDLAALARSAAVDESFVRRLTALGIIRPDASGYAPTDVYRVRFGALLAQAGIDLGNAARAIEAGIVSFGDLERMFPAPSVATSLDHAALAAELDIDLDLLLDVRLAAGLAGRRADDPVRSDERAIVDDIVALARALGSVELAPAVARMFGDRTERVASAALGLYRERVDRPWVETAERLDAEASRRGSIVGRELLDTSERLLLALYRRAIDDELLAGWLETTERLLARHGYVHERPPRDPGIAFVDLAGFTQLTDRDGDEAAMAVAMRLVAEAQRVGAAHDARIVKLLGDGVMLRASDPPRLVRAVRALVEALPAAGLPRAHAGVHAGPVVEQDGDVFGHTVNVAARIAAEAGADEVLASRAAVEGLADGFVLEPLPPRRLRGVDEPIELVRVTGGSAAASSG